MHPNLGAPVEQYLRDLSDRRNYARNTVQAYRRDLVQIATKLPAEVRAWNQVKPFHIYDLIAQFRTEGHAASTIARKLSALRSFFRFMQTERQVDHNPVTPVQGPKRDYKLPGYLSVDQAARMLDNKPARALETRDHAMFELLYSGGIRLQELVGLNLSDIDLDSGMARVTGKGNRTRDIPFGKQARNALQNWLHLRPDFVSDGEKALFISRSGSRLSRRSVQQRLARWGHIHGIEQPVHPHMFRHSFASHLLQSSGDLRAVQELLGHQDIRTTQIYTHLDYQHLSRVYDAAHPRARRKTSRQTQK